jgi:3-methyladenine DNA glycosylase AlkD
MAPADRVAEVLRSLERRGSARIRDEMGPRYGVHVATAYGVPMREIQAIAKGIGRDHDLAEALWTTACYEARLLSAYIGDPARVTAAQMDRWVRDFDNWGVVDTICFVLWDRTPHAWRKAAQWSRRREEFVKRTGFVLMACLALHDKTASDDAFLPWIPLLERGAADERNFVKKGVSWAIRAIGGRSAALNAATVAMAERLAGSSDATARSVGKQAVRELASRATRKRFAGKRGGRR